MSTVPSKVQFKVESGIQLIARLRRRPDIENFYTPLFENGPKHGEVIEIYSEENLSLVLIDMIIELILPMNLGGVNSGVLIFNMDGNLNFEILVNNLQKNIYLRAANNSVEQREYTEEEISNILHTCLLNLHILEIYDASLLYTTLNNLQSILMDNSNISMVIFHTLTAFYWSEQGFKITKMDLYLKNLLRMIKKATRDYKIITLYTRPEYFSSSKDTIEKLEGCSEHPTLDHINYRVQMLSNSDGSYQANVRSFSKLTKRIFYVTENLIKWL